MKFFKKGVDGGADSGVTALYLVEIKPLFSIVLLRFGAGSREAFHSHAFNALTWWIKGKVREDFADGSESIFWTPSFKPKYTPRGNFHKIVGMYRESYAISLRGPWLNKWYEIKKNKLFTLTHHRRVISETNIAHKDPTL